MGRYHEKIACRAVALAAMRRIGLARMNDCAYLFKFELMRLLRKCRKTRQTAHIKGRIKIYFNSVYNPSGVF